MRDNSDRYDIIYGKDFVGDSYGVKGLLPVVDEKTTFAKEKRRPFYEKPLVPRY